jgi:hypothetical protein
MNIYIKIFICRYIYTYIYIYIYIYIYSRNIASIDALKLYNWSKFKAGSKWDSMSAEVEIIIGRCI